MVYIHLWTATSHLEWVSFPPNGQIPLEYASLKCGTSLKCQIKGVSQKCKSPHDYCTIQVLLFLHKILLLFFSPKTPGHVSYFHIASTKKPTHLAVALKAESSTMTMWYLSKKIYWHKCSKYQKAGCRWIF